MSPLNISLNTRVVHNSHIYNEFMLTNICFIIDTNQLILSGFKSGIFNFFFFTFANLFGTLVEAFLIILFGYNYYFSNYAHA